jgi:hypothetical protein
MSIPQKGIAGSNPAVSAITLNMQSSNYWVQVRPASLSYGELRRIGCFVQDLPKDRNLEGQQE